MRDWFPVVVVVWQGCVMSPWLFHVYVDGIVREVNVRMLFTSLSLVNADSCLQMIQHRWLIQKGG